MRLEGFEAAKTAKCILKHATNKDWWQNRNSELTAVKDFIIKLISQVCCEGSHLKILLSIQWILVYSGAF